MGEAKRRAEYIKVHGKPQYDHTTHHKLSIKYTSEELIQFRKELLNHPDIMNEAQKMETFEEAVGYIAARLSIALDGVYEPNDLFSLLTTALRARVVTKLDAYTLHPNLVPAEMKEHKDGTLELVEELYDMAESFGMVGKEQSGTGRYTICDSCNSSFDCISYRSCRNNTPAVQLENTMKILKETLQ